MMSEHTETGAAPVLQFRYASSLDPSTTVFLLDGNASATMASVDNFPSQALTFSLWVKTTATNATQVLFSYDAVGDNSQRLWVKNPTDLAVGFGQASTGSTQCSINDGFWHQITIVVKPADSTHYGVQIYKDGLPVFQSLGLLSHAQDKVLGTGGQLVLGQGITGETGFIGQMSEFCLWNTALNSKQIMTRLQVRQSRTTSGAVIYWSLVSASSVTGQGGTITGGSFPSSPDLRFRQVQALTSWTAVNDATYEVNITDGRGRTTLNQTGITNTTLTIPDVLLNTLYLARVRAVVSGTPGPWSNTAQVTTLQLQQTVLDYNNTALQATWNDVDQKDQYVVSLYANQSNTPTVVEPPQTTSTFPIASQLASQETCRIEVQALTAGSYGPGNEAATTLDQPVFTLAYNSVDQQNPFLQVQWNTVPGAVRFYLTITKQGESTPALAVLLDMNQSPYIIPRSLVNFQDNEIYNANVRAVGAGYIGAWGVTQSVLITTLAAPQLNFVYADDQLNVTWGDIRTQAQKDAGLVVSYNLILDQGSNQIDQKNAIGNTDAERVYLVSSSTVNRLVIADSFTVKVQGTATGLNGVWSVPPTLTTPAATTFEYHWDNQATPLLVGWQTATGGTIQYYYYEIIQQGMTSPLFATVLNGTTTTDHPSAPVTEGNTLSLYARAMGEGFITALGTSASLTVHQIVAPIMNTPVADASAQTLTASWTFSDPLVPSPQYQVQLLQGTTILDNATVSTTSKTFTNAAIVAGNTLTVQVQTFQPPNFGKQATATITVTNSGSLPQVQGVACQSNTNGDLSLSWSPVNSSGVLYDAQVLRSDGITVQYTRTGISNNSGYLARSDTGVIQGNTYYVRVRATQGTVQGDFSTLIQVQAGTPSSNGGKPADNGDPVNMANGSYAYTNTDMDVIGVVPLLFVVHYDTITPLPADNPTFTGKPLGLRWNHIYNTKIAVSGSTAYLIWGSGRIDTYTVPSSITGIYTPIGVPTGDTLIYNSNLQYALTHADQSVYTFDRNGTLLQIANPAGNTLTLTYASQRLQQIKDDMSGRFLTLEYNADGLINKVSDSTGRFITYTYEQGNLKTMQDVMRQTRTFTYKSGNLSLIETITDQNGITFLKNQYDDQNRVIFQQDGRALQANATYGATITYQAGPQAGTVLTTFTDQEGNITEYTSLQANGSLLKQVIYLNTAKTKIRRTTLSYDGFNNVLTRTIYEGEASQADQLQGNTTTYTYDANNNPHTVTNPLQQTTTSVYTPDNQLQSYTDVLNNTMSYTYSGNLIQSVSNFLKQTRTMTYKSGSIKGLIATVTDELQNISTYEYYANGDLKSITNPQGEVLFLTTDTSGRVIQVENRNALGQTLKTLKLTYYASGLPQTVALWLDNQTEQQAFIYQYEYDHLGNQTKVTNPTGDATIYTYDPNDLLQKITYPTADGSVQETIYTYFKNNWVQQIAYSSQVKWQYTYDPSGRILTVTNPRNAVTTTSYEMLFAAGTPYPDKITTTYPQINSQTPAETSEIITDAATRLTSSKNRAGKSTTFAYTSQQDSVTQTYQRIVTTTLPLLSGQTNPYTTITIYDALARQVSYQNETNQVSTITYTSEAGEITSTFSLVTTTTDPLLNQRIQVTDSSGRLLSSTHGRGQVTSRSSYSYDVLGRLLLQRTQYNGTNQDTTYSYSYDAPNNWIKASLGSPVTTNAPLIQEYNALDLLVKDGNTTSTYNPRGQLFTYQNGRSQRLTYAYDTAGRFTSVTFPDNSKLVHTLDGNGNRLLTSLESDTNPAQPLFTRTFDVFNRMTSRTDTLRNTGVGYSYTALDSVSTLTYPDQKQVSYLYDNLGRLQMVSPDWNNYQTSYTYSPTGLIKTITFPNGCAAHYEYDAANGLQSVTHAQGNRLIYRITYTEVDALGNRKAAHLIMPEKPISSSSFTTTFGYNNANQIATVNTQTVGYDEDGNLTNMPSLSDTGAQVLLYDIYNQLISSNSDSYTYDADGLRVQSVVNGVTRQYVHDIRSYVSPGIERASNKAIPQTINAWTATGTGIIIPFTTTRNPPAVPGEALDRVLQLQDSNSNKLYRYVYGHGLISQEEDDGSNLRIYHHDSVGSTIALTDENGKLTDSYLYDPSGKLAGQSGNSLNPFLYNGRDGVITDANGLYYLRARTYRPDYLRFLQKDFFFGNLLDPQTLNRYVFVRGNPITYIDPLGLDKDNSNSLWWSIPLAFVLGAIIGGGIIAGAAGGGAGTVGTVLPASVPTLVATGEGALLLSEGAEGIEMTEMGTNSVQSTINSGLNTGARSNARSLFNAMYHSFIGKYD